MVASGNLTASWLKPRRWSEDLFARNCSASAEIAPRVNNPKRVIFLNILISATLMSYLLITGRDTLTLMKCAQCAALHETQKVFYLGDKMNN